MIFQSRMKMIMKTFYVLGALPFSLDDADQ